MTLKVRVSIGLAAAPLPHGTLLEIRRLTGTHERPRLQHVAVDAVSPDSPQPFVPLPAHPRSPGKESHAFGPMGMVEGSDTKYARGPS